MTIITTLLEFIKVYGSQLSAIGAVVFFIFATYKYLTERSTTLFWKEFEVFHKLIKELVEPPSKDETLFLDRQIAIVFELKNFKRYYPVSLRILQGIKESWSSLPSNYKRLIDEIDLTIQHIENNI